MSGPVTEAGKALLVSLSTIMDGPGAALFGQDTRNRILAIEAEAVKPWREALRELTEAAHDIYGMNEYDAPMVKARALLDTEAER